MTRQAPDPGNRESLGSGGSMVAKLKLKGIDGKCQLAKKISMPLTKGIDGDICGSKLMVCLMLVHS